MELSELPEDFPTKVFRFQLSEEGEVDVFVKVSPYKNGVWSITFVDECGYRIQAPKKFDVEANKPHRVMRRDGEIYIQENTACELRYGKTTVLKFYGQWMVDPGEGVSCVEP